MAKQGPRLGLLAMPVSAKATEVSGKSLEMRDANPLTLVLLACPATMRNFPSSVATTGTKKRHEMRAWIEAYSRNGTD